MRTETKSHIIEHIQSQKPGWVFTAFSFATDGISVDAARMALERMVAEGTIRKLDKGRYYRPEQTMFGEIEPEIEQVVGDLVEDKNHKLIGYLTGTIVFAQLGLTTQISSQIQLGVRKYRRAITRGRYTVSFVLQHNMITKENIPLLQLLDAMRFFRDIPATTPNEAVERLIYLVRRLSAEQKRELVELSMQYTPYVRALLGAIMEHQGLNAELEPLRASLNAMTEYKLRISEEVLPTIGKWNIK